MIRSGATIQKPISKLTTVQLIVLFYVITVCFSAILLSLPIALKPNAQWGFVDAIFTAVSAVSVTGLTVVSTADTFTPIGSIFLMFVFQVGGVGVMTLGTFIWLLFGKKIGVSERKLIMTDQNQSELAGLVKLMQQILLLIVIIEAIGALVLGTYFLNYFPTWQEAYLQGFFASVSATTNAGFDITGASLVPFAKDYFVQSINIILIFLGAIGFPVLIEIKEYFSYKGKYKYRFSLFAKITTFTFFALVVIGTVVIFTFEYNHFFADKSFMDAFFYSLFQSSTTKSAGLATLDVSELTNPTLLVMSVLMFIGASPSSAGGGIRTTTFAIIILTIFFYAKGKSTVKIFRREIHQEDIFKSFVVISTAMFLCLISVILISLNQPNITLLEIIFEVCSAFGTSGLSMGITPELNTFSKLILIMLMFIGRIGIFSFLFLIRGNDRTDNYHYPKEKIIIG